MRKVTLEQILHARSRAQGLFGDYPNRRMSKLLSDAWYITHKFSVNSRLSYNYKHPMKAIRRSAVEMMIGKQRVHVSFDTFALLYRFNQVDLKDQGLTDLVGDHGHISENELRNKHKSKGLSKLVTPYVKSSQLIIVHREQRKEYWMPSAFYRFLREQSIVPDYDDVLREIVTRIVRSYPFVNLDQIEALSGIDKFELGRPVHQLITDEVLERVQTDNLSEKFCVHGEDAIPRSSYPSFVLDSKDPMIILISKGREMELPGTRYYYFSDGSIQGGFNLKKTGDTHLVSNFRSLPLATIKQEQMLREIIAWGETQYLNLDFDQKNSPQGEVSSRFIRLLEERGYTHVPKGLVLNSSRGKTGKSRWRDAFAQVLSRKYTTIEEFMDSAIQVESEHSIKVRFDVPFVDLSKYPRVYGLGGRMAYISPVNLPLILCSEKKPYESSLIPDNVLMCIDSSIIIDTGEIIESLKFPTQKIKNALSFLEHHHMIRRLGASDGLDNQLWQRMEVHNSNMTKEECRVGIVRKLLQLTPPVTTLQLVRYLGWSLPMIQETLTSLISQGVVREGYFLEDIDELQYTIERETSTIRETGIEFYPSSEPIALHLTELIKLHPEIAPTESLSPFQEVFILLDNHDPIGYFAIHRGDEDRIQVFLVEQHIESVIPVLERIAGYFRKTGKLVTINNLPATDKRYERLRFAIELIGYRI